MGVGGCNYQTGDAATDARRFRVELSPSEGNLLISTLAAVPTDRGTEIAFSLSAPAQVSARVLNIAGRPVATIASSFDGQKGANTLVWDGLSDGGLRVPGGRYLIQLTARTDDGQQSQAMTALSVRR